MGQMSEYHDKTNLVELRMDLDLHIPEMMHWLD